MIKKIIIITVLTLTLTGCASTPPAEVMLSPVQYNQPIHVSSNKNAVLHWRYGEAFSKNSDEAVRQHESLMVGMIQSMVDASNPGRVRLQFGKARQAVFMTSLRDILNNNHVFKNTTLGSDSKKPSTNQVSITITFKETHIGTRFDGWPITLDANVLITDANGHRQSHNVLAQSQGSDDTRHDTAVFSHQQRGAAHSLMTQVIKQISQFNATTIGAT